MGLEPGHRVGVYEIVGLLGAGGMGEVYRARDSRLGRPVAIKFVSEDFAADPTASERLVREAQLASSLNHPNIVTVHDVGEIDGRPFIVMEFIAGQSLREALSAERLKLGKVVDIGCQIADGLAAAHRAGVVHRDLKPRNIMLAEDGRAKIVDFGLGKMPAAAVAAANDVTTDAPPLTSGHVVLGTIGYMSPEQVCGKPVTFQADQFALGAMLYEMIAGQRAFKRNTPVEIMAAVMESEPPPLSERSPSTPSALITIVERCLSKDANNRYASTHDLARALQDVRRALTTGRAATPHTQLAQRRRRRWLVAAAVVAGIGIPSYWLATRNTATTEARALLDRYDQPKNIDRAVELLTPVVAGGSTDPAAHTRLAEAYWYKYESTRDKSFIDKAATEASAAVKLDEKNPEVHVVLAMINLGQSRYEGALGEADRAISLDASNAAAWREAGRANQSLGRMAAAGEAFEKSVKLGPKDWTTHNNLGAYYLRGQKPKQAEQEFQTVLELAPDNTKAYNNLGATYLSIENYDKAIQMLQRSLSLDANNPTGFANLGNAYYRQQHYDDACRNYEKATSAATVQVSLWRSFGAACYFAPPEWKGKAKTAMEQALIKGVAALESNPKDPTLLADLADSHAVLALLDPSSSASHKAEARKLVSDAEKREPLTAEVMFMIASTHEELGDRQLALEWLVRSVKSGKDRKEVERSPWLKNLRQDPQYVKQFR